MKLVITPDLYKNELNKGRKAMGVGAISKNGKYRKEAMSAGDRQGKWILIKKPKASKINNKKEIEKKNALVQVLTDALDIATLTDEQRTRYVAKLESLGVTYNPPRDEEYIKNASLTDIKKKGDFKTYESYKKYVQVLYNKRERHAPNDAGANADKIYKIEDVRNIIKDSGLDIAVNDKKASVEARAYSMSSDINLASEEYAGVIVHELGHVLQSYLELNKIKYDNEFMEDIIDSPTFYGTTNGGEAFAEHVMRYYTDADYKDLFPKQYNLLKETIPEKFDALFRKFVTPPHSAKEDKATQKERASSVPISTSGTDSHLRRGDIKGQVLMFKTPYKGETGAMLMGYEWPHHVEEDVGKYGQEIFRKISHWEDADISKMTGRKFVHKFVIKKTDGELETMSAESAAVVLGISEASMRNKARGMLEKHIEAEAKQEKAKKEADAIEAETWHKTPQDSLAESTMGQHWIRDYQYWGKPNDRYTEYELRRNADVTVVPMLVNNKGEYQFGGTSGLVGQELEKRGIKEVKVAVSDIWDKEGNLKMKKSLRMILGSAIQSVTDLMKGRKAEPIGTISKDGKRKKISMASGGKQGQWIEIKKQGAPVVPDKPKDKYKISSADLNMNDPRHAELVDLEAGTEIEFEVMQPDGSIVKHKGTFIKLNKVEVDAPVAPSVAPVVSVATGTQAKGRGRPKGSKNINNKTATNIPINTQITTPQTTVVDSSSGTTVTPPVTNVTNVTQSYAETIGLKKSDQARLDRLVVANTKRNRIGYGQEVIYNGTYQDNKKYFGKTGKLIAIGDGGFAVVQDSSGSTYTAAWRELKPVGQIKPYSMYDGLNPDNVYDAGGDFKATLDTEMDAKIGNSNISYMELCKAVKARGFTLTLVGGAVRDVIAKKSGGIKDFDFIFDGTDAEIINTIKSINPSWINSTNVTNKHSGLLSFTDGKDTIDITPIHKYSEEMNGLAKGWTLVGDAAGRDLAMNSVQYDPVVGVVVDASGKGLNDIENNTLNFTDERVLKVWPVNVLRAFKFIARGYTMSPECEAMLKRNLPNVAMMNPARRVSFLRRQIGDKDGEKGLLKFKDNFKKYDAATWDALFEQQYQNIMPLYRGK